MPGAVASYGGIAARQLWRVLLAQGMSVGLVYRTQTAATPDYATGSLTATTRDTALTAILARYTTREIDGARVLVGDQKALVWGSALGVLPTTRDLVQVGRTTWSATGDTWEIVAHGDTGNGGILVLQLRQVGVA